MAISINEGTQTDILTTQIGGTETGIVRLDVGVGTTRSDFGGTLLTIIPGTAATHLGKAEDNAHVSGDVGVMPLGVINDGLAPFGAQGDYAPISLTDTGAAYVQQQAQWLFSGSIRVGTISKLPSDGTITQVTTLSNLTNGSVNILTGTVNRIHDLGTLGSVSAIGQIHNAGTPLLRSEVQDTEAVVPARGVVMAGYTGGTVAYFIRVGNDGRLLIGTANTLGTVSNLNNGSVNILTGTVTRTSNLGTLELGTMKLLATPAGSSILSHGTLGTAGGSFFATLSALSGSGTRTYVTHSSIVMQSGTADVRILAGSAIQGTGVITAGQFPAGGGIATPFFPPFDAGDNSALLYHFVGAGTAFITIKYFKAV